MTNFNPLNFKTGQVVLVKFPFANLQEAKKRPTLVHFSSSLAGKIKLVTIAMITSSSEGAEIEGDLELEDWKEAGLLHRSLVRLSKVATLDSDLIEKILGNLEQEDLKRAKKLFRKQFGFWIDR